MEFVVEINSGKQTVPTTVFPDGDILLEPSNAALVEKMGLQTKARQEFYDAIVVGGGPAGLTAAPDFSREGKDTLAIEKAALGGQSGITQTRDNFPGFDEGISGAEFAERLGPPSALRVCDAPGWTPIQRPSRWTGIPAPKPFRLRKPQ
jgi:hypothetical protein